MLGLGAILVFLRLKEKHQPVCYETYVMFLYRDITFFAMLLVYLIEIYINFISFSLMIIPFFLTPPLAFALVELFSFKNNDLDPSTLTSPGEIESYIFSLLQAIGRDESLGNNQGQGMSREHLTPNDCYLMAMLNVHSQSCESPDCICAELGKEGANAFRTNRRRKNWLLFVKEQLAEFLQRHSKDPQLHITAACLQYYWFNNFFTALDHLARVYALQPSIPVMISALFIHRQIEKDLISGAFASYSDSEGNKNMTEILKANSFLKLFNRFLKKVEFCTANSIEFWSMLTKDTPDVVLLGNIGNTVFDCMRVLRDLYYKITDCDPNNLTFLYIYAVFLKYVVYDEVTANTIFARVRSLRENRMLNKHLSYFESGRGKTMMIKVSGDQETMGKILDVNLETSVELKYDKDDFKRINMSKLMPPFVADKHGEWIKRSYEMLNIKNMHAVTQIFVADKDGYYIFTNSLLRLVPNLKDGISFIISLRANRKMTGYFNRVGRQKESKKSYSFLLFNGDDNVVGLNDNASHLFNVHPKELRPESTLQALIPELAAKEVYDAAKSNRGHLCSVDLSSVERVLGDTDKVVDDSGEEHVVKQNVWMRLFEHVYGEEYNLPCTLKVLVLQKITGHHFHSPMTKLQTKNDNFDGSDGDLNDGSNENLNEQQIAGLNENLSVSIASSQASNISSLNLAKELKASLYERKTPSTVKLFIYTIWSIYLMMLVACIVDWVISYQQAARADELISFVGNVMSRFNCLTMVTTDARTIDLILRGLEVNPYYGDDFYVENNKHVI